MQKQHLKSKIKIMKETIKIIVPIPTGYKTESFDINTNEITAIPIVLDVKERIQSMADVFELNNTTEEKFNKKWKGFAPHEVGQAKEVLIVSAYNRGVFPDWEDGTAKYYPRFYMGSSSGVGFSYDGYDNWITSSGVGSRLCFVGKDAKANMLDAVEKFLPEYKEARTL